MESQDRKAEATTGGERTTVNMLDQEVRRGHGGELHQTAAASGDVLTTNQGIPVSDDQNSLIRKFIGCGAHAEPLLKKASVLDSRDDGFVPLRSSDDVDAFVTACRKLRFWQRENAVKPV